MNSEIGIVFDLLKFSIHDGPGIRTTIFLKGCPLSCEWCHNPESQSSKPQLSFNMEKCINCFDCVDACPNNAHKIFNGKHYVDWSSCKTEGECVNVCSSGALKIIGEKRSVEEIINEVKKDIKYYKNSGGGVTISGGEPLAQFNFIKKLLIALKHEEIHTCIETCGYAKKEYYQEILPYTDLFLFDFKFTSDIEHKKYTGVSSKLILSNLDFLYKNGAAIILRCPLIPGINDNEEHYSGINTLIKKYPKIRSVELMPYHKLGLSKAVNIGYQYRFNEVMEPDDLLKENWLRSLNNEKIVIHA